MNNDQLHLLKELKRNPVWASILRDLKPDPVRPWSSKAVGEEKKVHQWIYDSGKFTGIQNVLKALGYDDD